MTLESTYTVATGVARMTWGMWRTRMKYGDYRDPLPGEASNAYWERLNAYEKAHGIDPTKGSTPWPTPRRMGPIGRLLFRLLSRFRSFTRDPERN